MGCEDGQQVKILKLVLLARQKRITERAGRVRSDGSLIEGLRVSHITIHKMVENVRNIVMQRD